MFMGELARDRLKSLFKAWKKFFPVEFPIQLIHILESWLWPARPCVLMRTQSIKLQQFPLSHSLGVDRWWEEDLLPPKDCCGPGVPSCTPSPGLPTSVTERGARLLAFCLPGSQKVLRVFP